MRFGINVRNRLTGADLYVRIFQLTGLAPVLYVLVACVHPAVFTSENVFSVLFRLGMSALPRWEALGLSRLYRMSHSEVLVCAAVLVFALIFGLAAGRLLRGGRGKARAVRVVLAVLIALDLVVRVLPLPFRFSFGIPAAVFGFVIRLGCLALVLGDLTADRRNTGE
ncbi:MAG: hypothetical protein K6C09_02750 [Oscillospiraceae bacterium]|nr:hypothetical protein [Oscillospiraceae bacterium]